MPTCVFALLVTAPMHLLILVLVLSIILMLVLMLVLIPLLMLIHDVPVLVRMLVLMLLLAFKHVLCYCQYCLYFCLYCVGLVPAPLTVLVCTFACAYSVTKACVCAFDTLFLY